MDRGYSGVNGVLARSIGRGYPFAMRGILLAALFTPGTCFAGLNFVSSSTVYVDSDATAFASRVWIGKDDRIWLSGRLQGRTVLAEFDP